MTKNAKNKAHAAATPEASVTMTQSELGALMLDKVLPALASAVAFHGQVVEANLSLARAVESLSKRPRKSKAAAK